MRDLVKKRSRAKELREQRKLLGRCAREGCDQVITHVKKSGARGTLCESHRLQQNERQRVYYKKESSS